MESSEYWKKCSSCKKSIHFGTKYYTCSVSTCNGKRTGYVFCGVGCFEAHLPGARHKDAAAIEETSPKGLTHQEERKPQRRFIKSTPQPQSSSGRALKNTEILIIASRLKDFIAEQSEFNTSSDVMSTLSNHIRHVAMQAIDNARAQGRKTVMEQDLVFLKKLKFDS